MTDEREASLERRDHVPAPQGDRSPTHAADPAPNVLLLLSALNVTFRLLILGAVSACIIAILRWGVLPIVQEVSGENTTFEFSFVVNISIVLNVVLSVALAFSEGGRRKANKELRESPPPID